MKALTIDGCQSLIRLSLPTRTAWTMPACSRSSGAQHTLGEVAISQNTTSSTWQRGFLLQPPSNCLCPSPRGDPGHQQFQAGSAVCYPVGQRQHGQCPLPTEGWKEGDRLGVPGPREREEGEDCRAVAGLLNLPGSVSKEHHFLVFFLKKKKSFIY